MIEIIPFQPIRLRRIEDIQGDDFCLGQPFTQKVNRTDVMQFQIKSTNLLPLISSGEFIQVARLMAVLISTTNESETGASDGSILFGGSGGEGSYEYSIDGVSYQPTGLFENLSEGLYTIYVRDENGTVATRTARVYVNVTCGDYEGVSIEDIYELTIGEFYNCTINDLKP
jgi:hypothetical protein